VAISLGTSRPSDAGVSQLAWFFAQATAATVLACLMVYLAYRFSDRISRAIGPTGTSIVVRHSTFLLFWIGIQVLWTGAAELLASVVGK
jgi:multiple antibiotic resistance protein